MNSENRVIQDQIPTEFNDEQTTRVVRKQNRTPGECREKTISDFGKAAVIGLLLKDLKFPASRQEVIESVTSSSLSQKYEILSDIKSIGNAQYHNAFEVARAAKLVSQKGAGDFGKNHSIK